MAAGRHHHASHAATGLMSMVGMSAERGRVQGATRDRGGDVETRLSRLRRRRRWRRGARVAAAGAVLMSAVPLLPGHDGTRPGYVASGEPDTRHPLIGAAPNPRGPFA